MIVVVGFELAGYRPSSVLRIIRAGQHDHGVDGIQRFRGHVDGEGTGLVVVADFQWRFFFGEQMGGHGAGC